MLSKERLNNSLFVGVDTHKYENTAVAANRFEEELGVYQFANQNDSVEKFIQKIEALSDHTGLTPIFGIEGSGGNGLFLVKRLIQDYTQVYEVNSIFTKSRRTLGTNWSKSDHRDAKLVVSVLTREVGNLPRLSEEHTHREYYLTLDFVVSAYEELVKERARLKNQLHRLFHEQDLEYRKKFKTVFSKKALKSWKWYCYRYLGKKDNDLLDIKLRLILSKINRLNQVGKQIKKLEEKMKMLVAESGQQLLTLPGVDFVNAARLLAYVKNINRFGNADKFVRYIGCVPEQKSSGGTIRHQRATMSNRNLYRTVRSIMLTQLRVTPKAKEYYRKKLSEGKTKKQAQRSLMKRIGIIIHGMMKHQGAYTG